jgi:CPA2 family monovalent cation:H+ antiporter-2
VDHAPILSALILIAASVLVLAVFRRLAIPPIIGYVVVGAAVGPHALGLVPAGNSARLFAEFGVVFLLFNLGLEFSLARLMAMRRLVFGLGSAQVVITTLAGFVIALLLGAGPGEALLLGGAAAMSSTALVARQLSQQIELQEPHGSAAIAVLLFQDMAIVLFLALVPVLAGDAAPGTAEIAARLGQAVLVLAVVLLAGHWLLRPMFHEIAGARTAELFTLAVLLVVLAAAYATESAGLSGALGAFLAGIMLAETEYRHQIETDIRPFRDLLLGLFFITVGMTLDLALIRDNAGLILGLTVGLIAGKAWLVTVLARRTSPDRISAVRTGLVLAQGGEFSFALITLALQAGSLGNAAGQPLLVAIVFSMAISPLIVRHNLAIAYWLTGSPANPADQGSDDLRAPLQHDEQFVLICGYGRVGQNLARLLGEEAFPSLALDIDPAQVRAARAAGDNVIYGDAGDPRMLEAVGLGRARMVVVTLPNWRHTLKILTAVRRTNPDVPILVRARDDTHLDLLQKAGATEVVPETLEASLMLASHLLLLLGMPVGRLLHKIQEIRDDRYSLLRSVFHRGVPTWEMPGVTDRVELRTVALTDGAAADGRRLDSLGLDDIDVMVTALRRDGIVGRHPLPETVLRTRDVLVLFGRPEDLEKSEAILLTGTRVPATEVEA